MSIYQAIKAVETFQGTSLTESISSIEKCVRGMRINELQNLCARHQIDDDFIASALSIKKIARQINVVIHAAGILRSLQHIMEPEEEIISVSLGAGNTGRKFDLETNFRVAEYKFIDWQGGAESIRQNGIFKDFVELAEDETTRRKYLYVVGTEFPLKFLRGGRVLTSVLSRQPAMLARINEKYPSVKRACDYYDLKSDEVSVCDIAPYIGRSR